MSDEKPRIALLLSGLPRLWNPSLRTQLDLLQDFPFDVYFHFWDTIDAKEKDEIVTLLKPRAYAFEAPKDFSFADIDPTLEHDIINIPSRMFSQYYSWREVGKLFQPFRDDYDLAIRSRADLEFVYGMNDVFRGLNPNEILMPWWNTGTVLSDLFAVGGVEPILYYHSLYDHVRDYASTKGCNSELMITAHFEARKDIRIYTYEGQKYFFVRRPHMTKYTQEEAMLENPGRNKWFDPEVVKAHEDFHRQQKGEEGAVFVKNFREIQLSLLVKEVSEGDAPRKAK